MRDTVVEVGGVAAAEQIDCGFAFGGTVTLARNRPQLERVADDVAADARWGDESHLLDADGVAEHVRAAGVVGGSFTPDCARIQPARLVRGLLDVVLSRGARLVEGTRALRLSPRAVVTDHGIVRARWVVRATEAWSAHLPGSRRDVAPVYSHMIATEPLPPEVWARDRAGPRADVHRRAATSSSTASGPPTTGSRSAGAARRTTWAPPSGPRTTRSSPPPRTSSASWSTCSRCSTGPRSRTTGAARSACRATGTRRSGSTPRPGSAGPAGTSATASR